MKNRARILFTIVVFVWCAATVDLAKASELCNSGAKMTVGLIPVSRSRSQIDERVLNAASNAFIHTHRFDIAERTLMDSVAAELGEYRAGGMPSEGIRARLGGIDIIGFLNYSTERKELKFSLDGKKSDTSYKIEVRLVDVRDSRHPAA